MVKIIIKDLSSLGAALNSEMEGDYLKSIYENLGNINTEDNVFYLNPSSKNGGKVFNNFEMSESFSDLSCNCIFDNHISYKDDSEKVNKNL